MTSHANNSTESMVSSPRSQFASLHSFLSFCSSRVALKDSTSLKARPKVVES